jgi:hypothetical protein
MPYFSTYNLTNKPYSMRKLLLLSATFLISTALLAQKGKSRTQQSRDVVLGTGSQTEPSTTTPKKGKKEENSQQTTRRGSDPVWEGTSGLGKPSKNQPAKVRAAFARDYPNATGVTWSKYRGDWTATFHNGIFRSTAVYHANGERRDTRTLVPKTQVPRTILDGIIKRRPGTRLGDIIKIEVPQAVKDIFRVKTSLNGTTQYLFFNADGAQVSYDY